MVGFNGTDCGLCGSCLAEGEFRDERGKARDKGARAVFLEGAKVREEVTIVSDDGRDSVGFFFTVEWVGPVAGGGQRACETVSSLAAY